MRINIDDLPPWAQAQVAQKVVAQNRDKAEKSDTAHSKQINKYRNIPDSRNGAEREIKFKSRKEARRYDELMLMLKSGQIHELKLQPQFTLQEAYTTPEGVRVRAIRYDADFSYNTGYGLVVEDVKSKATKTRVYAMKKKLMQERFGISIAEVE